MSTRYEIREQELSETVAWLLPDLGDVLYVVWDLELDRRVPFGNYRDRHQAEGRIERLKARDTAQGRP